jgi:hypothetical protein
MNKKEIAELVKISDCPEIQGLWKPNHSDQFVLRGIEERIEVVTGRYERHHKKGKKVTIPNTIWLPRIEDCIRMMGYKFNDLYNNDELGFTCRVQKIDSHSPFGYQDKSARIACLKALKATLRGYKKLPTVDDMRGILND